MEKFQTRDYRPTSKEIEMEKKTIENERCKRDNEFIVEIIGREEVKRGWRY